MKLTDALAACGLLAIATLLPAGGTEAAEPPLTVAQSTGSFELMTGDPKFERCEVEECPDIATVGPAVCPDGTAVFMTVCARKSGESCGWKYACEPEPCVVQEGDACYGPTACTCGAGLWCELSRSASGAMTGVCARAIPCTVDGQTYQPDETFKCECNTCQCISGDRISTTLMLCDPRPSR